MADLAGDLLEWQGLRSAAPRPDLSACGGTAAHALEAPGTRRARGCARHAGDSITEPFLSEDK